MTKKMTPQYIMNLLTRTDHTFKTLQEDIYEDRLNYIINNEDLFSNQFDKTDWDKNYNPFTLAKNYLNKSINGKVNVLYRQRQGVGRFFAMKSLSLQSLSKEIRHSICKGYIDIDIENAHPTFLYYICKKMKIPHENLKKYVKNRDEILKEIGKDKGKKVFLSLLNGGNKAYDELENKTPFLQTFKIEIGNIHKLLCNHFKDKYNKNKTERIKSGNNFNHRGSFVNKLLCDFENKILMSMYEFYGKPNNCVWCFDGLMLKDDKGYENQLRECEEYVKEQYKINIKLKVKPFDKGFDLSKYVIPSYNGCLFNEYFDYMKFAGKNKEVELDLLEHWTNTNVFLIDGGGKNSILTRQKKIDRITKQTAFSYYQIKLDIFLKNMKINCLVKNPKFDPQLCCEIQSLEEEAKAEGKKFNIDDLGLTLEQKKSLVRHLYTNLKDYFTEIIEDRVIKTYKDLEFIPYMKKNGEPNLYNSFNVFTGFPLEEYEYDDEEKHDFENSVFFNHIKTEMCNDNEAEFNHLLDYIADMIQKPDQMRGNAHLFISEQGTGKGLLAFFIQKLLGINHCITFDNIADYFSNFNADKSNKLFKVIEEVSDKGEAFYKADILKADLTKTRERIEPKGLDAYTLNHFARYFFFSNNDNAIYIENSDRRYTIHKIRNTYANNKKYFKPMWDDVNDNNYCKNAFEYFSNRKYEELDVMEAFINKAKKDQKLNNMSITLKMIYELIESDFEGMIRYDSGYCNVSDFKTFFKDWCEENGQRFKLSTMKTQLKKFGLEEERVYEEKKRVRAYNMNSMFLQDKFKKFLKDDNMTFDIIKNEN